MREIEGKGREESMDTLSPLSCSGPCTSEPRYPARMPTEIFPDGSRCRKEIAEEGRGKGGGRGRKELGAYTNKVKGEKMDQVWVKRRGGLFAVCFFFFFLI